MTRAEHLKWCKERALREETPQNMWASMCSDLNKHGETRDHIGINLGMVQIMSGRLSTISAMRDFVEGFN